MTKLDLDNINLPSYTTFDQLLLPVNDFVIEQNRTLFHHPNEKFIYPMFFRLIIYYVVSQTSSIRLFMNELKHGLIPDNLGLKYVPYSTFNEAFERFSPKLFQDVFHHLLKTLPLKKVPELAAFGTLYCIDGSLFPVINSMLWAEYTSKHQALRLHLCFELNRMIPVDFLVDSGSSCERKALKKMLVSGVTYIADRGYMSFSLANEIVKSKSYLIFRVKSNLKFNITKTSVVNIPLEVNKLFDNVTDQVITYINDKNNNKYRLITFDILDENYFILTNRFELTTFQIIMLYAYRWQIELLFRFLKRTMGSIHLIKQDKDGVTIQFYTFLITALLELNLKQKVMDIDEDGDITASIENNDMLGDEENKTIIEALKKKGTPKIINLSKKVHDGRISEAYQFFKIIGNNVKKYWKIGIHWLNALNKLLDKPFNDKSISILRSL